MEHNKGFNGSIERTIQDSRSSWVPQTSELKRRPNIVMIVLDDVG